MNAQQRYRNRINAAWLEMDAAITARKEDVIEYRRQDAEAQGTSNHDLTPDQRMDMKGMV